MKHIKYIYKAICLTGLLAVSTTSCTDWLTIYPQDRVVEENFWEDKNDLDGVRYAAYRQMASSVSKLAVWGDLRSDSYEMNTIRHSDQKSWDTYNEIVTGMPDSSMGVFDWGEVYTTINYCNKVLQHGAEVLEKDKQFTKGEWLQMKAEMTALRALNYFYLIRAFKDVPYTTKVVNKDSEVEDFPLTNQLAVLDSIIRECESVKGQARNRFSQTADSKGMITNTAIYAMLADMYLWRASLLQGRYGNIATSVVGFFDGEEDKEHTIRQDYEKAIEYAEMSLNALANQNEEERNSFGPNVSYDEAIDYGLGNSYSLIKNNFDGASQSTTPSLEAFTSIFYRGNSRESIFELQYSRTDDLKNDAVNSLYGYNNGTHLQVSKNALDAIYNGGIGGSGDNGGMWDSRLWVCCQNRLSASFSSAAVQPLAGYYCMKYEMNKQSSSVCLSMDGSSENREIRSFTYSSDDYNNWIVYRMTDVMLIKAEAKACIGGTQNNNEARQICNAIHRRAYCNYRDASKVPTNDVVNSATRDSIGNSRLVGNDYVKMVLNERQIELLGEGKRWFDLVRYAERNSYAKDDPDDPREEGFTNGQTGVAKMVDTFLKNAYQNYATTLKNRFKNRYGLYCPIYYMEVKASNGAIEQNPVWNKSKYEH